MIDRCKNCYTRRYVYEVIETHLCPKHEQESWEKFIKETTSGWPKWAYVASGSVTSWSFTAVSASS